jgi:AcrR family transcriptional regulator
MSIIVDMTVPKTTDRRVRRSRSALMRAAVALVAERGTSNVSLSEIAEAADVSRQLVYQQFGDRDSLLLAAALDLAEREFVQPVQNAEGAASDRDRVLAGVRHFAEHRSLYRALLTGPCAYDLNKALTGLLTPVNRRLAERMAGERRSPDLTEDLAVFLTGGSGAVFNTWIVEGEDPLDPEAFTDRLMRMLSVVAEAFGEPAKSHGDQEHGR